MAETKKLVLLGDHDVGKTTLILKYFQWLVPEKKDESIEYTYTGPYDAKRQRYIKFLDTTGAEKHWKNSWIGSGDAYIIVYSSISARSFEWATSKVHQIRTSCPIAPIALVANKSDIDGTKETPKIPRALGERVAKEMMCFFSETSALGGMNVREAINTFSEVVFSVKSAPTSNPEPSSWWRAGGRKCDLFGFVALFTECLRARGDSCEDSGRGRSALDGCVEDLE